MPCRSLADHLKDYYLATGDSLFEVIKQSSYYRDLPPYPSDVWARWLSTDIPNAFVPFVETGERFGAKMPLHRAAIAMSGALLGRDLWREGVTLARMGLENRTGEEIRRYVATGW